MREYRQNLKEKDPEEFLRIQREQKQKLRAKAKESKIFEVPYVESKKPVKIILKTTPVTIKITRWYWGCNPATPTEIRTPITHL